MFLRYFLRNCWFLFIQYHISLEYSHWWSLLNRLIIQIAYEKVACSQVFIMKKKINNLINNWREFKKNSVEKFSKNHLYFLLELFRIGQKCGEIEQNEWNFDDCLIDIKVIYWFRCFIYCFHQYTISSLT